MSADLSIVIVNYRTPALVSTCIASILRNGVARASQIVVVDNFSQDDSVERISKELPDIHLISSPSNGGFGAGVNLGVQQVSTDKVLVLNPDTYFEVDSVSPCLSYMDGHPEVGVIGLDLVNPDGSRQYSGRRFYSFLDVIGRRMPLLGRILERRIDNHLMKQSWSGGTPFDADWVMGTGFIIRRSLFAELRGMDEDYFLYLEDTDLCARVWQAGYRVVCVPGSYLVHDHQRSSSRSPFNRAARLHMASLLKFRKKFRVPLFRQESVASIVGSTVVRHRPSCSPIGSPAIAPSGDSAVTR